MLLPTTGIDIVRIVLCRPCLAAFVAEADNNGVFVGDDEDVLSEYSPHVRDIHTFVVQMPELEAITAVRFIIFLEEKSCVGRGRFFQITFGDQLPAVPTPVIQDELSETGKIAGVAVEAAISLFHAFLFVQAP